MIGILIWDTIISLEPLSAIAPEIGVLRGVSRSIQKKKDWDQEFSAQAQRDVDAVLTQEALQAHALRLTTNRWRTHEIDPNRRTFYLASDATETSIAGVLLSDTGRVITHYAKLDMAYRHIFIHEVYNVEVY